MKNIIIITVVAVFIVTLIRVSGGKSPAEDIGYGEIKENRYINTYFNMTIDFPKDWATQSKEAMSAQIEVGSNMVVGDDENQRAAMKVSSLQSLNLFSVSQYPRGTPVSFNPNILCIAEKIAHMPGVKRGSDYFFFVKKFIENSPLKVQFSDDISTEKISNVDFDILQATTDYGNTAVLQKYYAAKLKDYMLSLIITYSSDEEREKLEKILQSLKISK